MRVHVTDILSVNGDVHDLSLEGEGTTIPNGGGYDIGISGREYEKVRGAGSTDPVSGTNPNQILPDPAWLIFGHELCGHAGLGTVTGDRVMHSQTPEGDRTSVDVENRIRREHSTVGNSLGIRHGEFFYAVGMRRVGLVYKVAKGETLSEIAVRCGFSQSEILTRVFRESGSAVTAAERDAVQAGERLMIEGIQWHEVIRGESMPVIARIWGVPEGSLRRANPHIDPDQMRAGQRLLIPVS